MSDQIFEEHRHLIRDVRQLVAPHYRDREDLEAEGALILLQAIRNYDPSRGTKLSTFAVHQLRGGYQHVIRKTKREQQPHRCLPQLERDPTWTPEDEGEDGIDQILDPAPSPEARVVTQTEQEAIWDALIKLPDHWRQVIWLRYWIGATYAECSQKLGRSIPTVRGYELKALERLRGLLAELFLV